MIRRWLLLGAAAAWLLSGCGGSRTAVPTGRGGSIALTVKWPERDRLVPLAANSLRMTVSLDGQELATRVLVRPTSGGFSTATVDNLRVATLTVTAAAYPGTDATGVVQAQGTVTADTQDGQTTAVTLTMGSTIDHLVMTPADPSVVVRGTVQLAATAVDASGAMVLVTASKMTWQTSDAGIATVNSSGLVTGVAAGTAQITATETESGKSASIDVTVVGGSAGNLLVNGDFSAGNIGFSSQYIYTATFLTSETMYTVGMNPKDHHYRQVGSFGDHTTGTGLMFIGNGASAPNMTVWEETVDVVPNADYVLTGWTAAWGGTQGAGYRDPSPTRLRILINGTGVATHNLDAQDGNWTSFSVNWNSGANTQATITFVDTNTALDGNDFALDDLSFAEATRSRRK